MIGFYNYTVILTYMAVMSAVVGITQLVKGRLLVAVVCLMIAGFCDMFDGKVARMKKDRTDREKVFGIQIDSLSDVICFGVFPAMFNYEIAVLAELSLPLEIFSIFVSAYFAVAAVARLGYFNVVEEERQRETSENRKNYQGLPVTSIAMILPVAYIAKKYVEKAFDATVYSIAFSVLLLIIGFLFVYDFKIKKPNNKEVAFIIVCAVIIIALCVLL